MGRDKPGHDVEGGSLLERSLLNEGWYPASQLGRQFLLMNDRGGQVHPAASRSIRQ